jgi:arginine-tRNA-protein transferase
MRYKSEYSPSYLLDPVSIVISSFLPCWNNRSDSQGTLQFHLLNSNLDKYLQAHPTGYHPFAYIPTLDKASDTTADNGTPTGESTSNKDLEDEDESDEEMEQMDEFPSPAPPGFSDPASFTQQQLDELLVLMKARGKSRVIPLGVSCPSDPPLDDRS